MSSEPANPQVRFSVFFWAQGKHQTECYDFWDVYEWLPPNIYTSTISEDLIPLATFYFYAILGLIPPFFLPSDINPPRLG